MFSISGIYDGEKIYPTKKINNHKKYKVIITFIEGLETKDQEDKNLRDFGTNMSAMEFWKDEKEDIYQDYLIKDSK
ncbi:MAG: hypothetical protein ACRDE2_01540 [Chitinophagaceae bacterium]